MKRLLRRSPLALVMVVVGLGAVVSAGASALASGTITTIAGKGTASTPGYSGDGGPAISARLYQPHGVGVDGQGNVYIADYNNHRVRKISRAGKITTIAGNGQRGDTVPGGPATSTIVWGPHHLAVDAKGIIYLTPALRAVYRVSADGILTLFAGGGSNPTAIGDGGPATSAYLGTVGGLAVDKKGNVYIAQSVPSARVRIVRPDGIITTFAVAPKGIGDPSSGLAVDGKGNLYVGTTAETVYKVSPGGKWMRIAGTIPYSPGFSGDGGPATKAKLNRIRGVAVDSRGNVYISDSFNQRVRKVTPGGKITTFAGSNSIAGLSGDGGPATKARLANPFGVAVDRQGNVYIAEWNNRVRKVSR